jgi:hypothetical protein
MPMVASTTETRDATCEACGLPVIETKQILLAREGETFPAFWNTPRHDAPCGLPCFGGGVPARAYRAGIFHRDAERCPKCDLDEGGEP